MSKVIKILVATHKKYEMPEDSMYLPIHVGREGKEDIGYQGDNTGDNISVKNENYCELTGIYWAWKNLNCDYIGLCHYRRYFKSSDPQKRRFKKKKILQILGREEVEELLSKYDVILPKKRNYYIDTVWSHFGHSHNIKDLEEVEKIIQYGYPEFYSSFKKVMNNKKLHLYNMFIMKKSSFDEYCEWLFEILHELENRIDISGYDNYQRRIYGFISERLFNVWLDKQQLTCKEHTAINLEKIYWGKKIYSFLKRHFRK